MSGTGNPLADRHPAQWLALVVGVVYTVVGIAGFAITGIDGFADPQGELLLGVFEVNPLHNVVHLLIGLAGVALSTRLQHARVYGWLLAVGYGAVFVFGLFVANTDDQANVLALNEADNWLHAASAVVGLVIALWPSTAGSGNTGANRPGNRTQRAGGVGRDRSDGGPRRPR